MLMKLSTRIPKTARQFATLLTGTGAASLLNFLSFAIVARELGPAGFGLLTLVRSYSAVVVSLSSFQSHLAVIKYGSDALAAHRPDQLGALVRWGLILDTAAGLLGALVGGTTAWLVGPAVGVPREATVAVCLYLFLVPLAAQSTPNAVLRLYDEYRTTAVVYASGATLCLASIAVLSFGLGSVDVRWYLTAFFVSEASTALICMYAAARVLGRQGVPFLEHTALRRVRDQWPGIVRFVAITNAQGTAKQLTSELDIFVVGSTLGTAAAGLYKVAKQLSSMSSKVLEPLSQVGYPLLARLVAERRYTHVRRAIINLGAFAGSVALAFWLVFFFFSRQIIELTVGQQYLPAAGVAVWYFAALTMMHASIGLPRALLALGRPGLGLWLSLPLSFLYVGSLPLWMGWRQLEGAGIAHFVYHGLLAFGTAGVVAIILRQLQSDDAPGAPALAGERLAHDQSTDL
jgi:O-antigen/teichoic acid export membrane protein